MPLPAPGDSGVTSGSTQRSRGRWPGGCTGPRAPGPREAAPRSPQRSLPLACGQTPGAPRLSSRASSPPLSPHFPPPPPPPLPFLEGKAAASFWALHPWLSEHDFLPALSRPGASTPSSSGPLPGPGDQHVPDRLSTAADSRGEVLSPPTAATEKQGSEMSAVLRELLRVSEKAANIARACRQQEALFQLLIEEKKEGEKNKKFTVDFKTLADVLVQEVIKQNMENKFPGLGEKIFGEESNEFTNDLGEKIILRLCPTEQETVELLSKVLNGNKLASEALAKVVHQDVTLTDPTLDSTEITIPQDTLGIWVDPIDSTYQYIKGSADIESNQGIFPSGLQCVTILIGVYDVQTGVPLMGVINQPFASRDPNTLRWKGQCYWGLSYMGTNIHSQQPPTSQRNNSDPRSQLTDNTSSEAAFSQHFSAVISTSEKEAVKAALSRVCGDSIFRAAGAGYKSLCVVQGLVDFYIFSEDTTFKWDSCAAHAILRAMGGGMVDFKECLDRNLETGLDLPQLLYHVENENTSGVDRWANRGGLIAYRSRKQLETFLSLFLPNLAPADTHT